MTNADGQVRIKIEDNALKVAANLSKLQDRFSTLSNDVTKYERILAKVEGTENAKLPIYDKIRQKLEEQKEAIKQATNEYKKLADIQKSGLGYNQLNNLTQTAIERLRNLALQGRTNSAEFKELANTIKNSNKQIKEADSAVERATQDFKDFSIAGINVSNALKAISAVAIVKTLSDIGQQAIKTAGEFEQLETSFKIMAGGAEQGEKLTKSLINLASKTPMTTAGLAKASQTLLSFGESAENIIDDLKLLGDISGGEEQRFQSLALAFAQVGSTGRLTGQDLLQMVNQGFNPLQAISEKTGKSMAQLKKEMGEGKISFEMIKQAMIDATSEGGRFYGLMNEQSGTLNGLLSTNADTWQQVSKNIGDGFMPVAKEAVRVLIALGNSILNLQRKMADFQKSFNYKTVESATRRYEGTLKESQYYSDLAAKEEKRAASARGAGQREAILSRAESYKKRAQSLQASAIKYKLAIEEIKKAEAEANKPSASGGFGSSGSGSFGSGTSASIEKIKDAFEKAQEKAQEAEKAFKLALYQSGGNVTPQVEAARLKMVETKKAVDTVQKAFETLTANGKTNFELINYNIEQTKQKIQNLAAADIVDLQAIKNAQAELKNWQDKLTQINELITPRGAYQVLNDKVTELTTKLRDLAAVQQIGSAEWNNYKAQLDAAQKEVDAVNKSLEDNGIKVEDVSKKISSSLSSGLVNALRNGGNAFEMFSNLATTALQKILDKLLEMAVVTPILNAFTGGSGGTIFGAITKLFASKDGNVFENGNVIPFAKGGVVSKPTVFPMANGGTGLMGEAGAEAVMPLRRMNNGKLGVEADNSGNAVQVNIYNQSNSEIETRKRNDGSTDIIIKKVNEALMNERTSSGFRAAYQREDRKGLQAV